MLGSATFTIVMSSSSMSMPRHTARRVHHLRAIRPPPRRRFQQALISTHVEYLSARRQVRAWHAAKVALRCAIVDDKPEFLEAARNLLERQGVAVVGLVSTAADAVERVQELAP